MLSSPDIGKSPEKPQKPSESSGFRSAKGLNALDPTRRAAVSRRLAEMPASAKGLYRRVVTGKASPRQAIAECTGYACPLWGYRPFQSADEGVDSHE